MCGLVGFVGRIDDLVLGKLIYESGVRGLHHLGEKVDKKGRAGIYHCRYITSGDTDQPLTIGDGRYLAFNGVINMGTKEEMEEEYEIQMSTDNDGEVILRCAANPKESLEFLYRHPEATFAGLWLEPNKLVALRNEGRPLWIHYNPYGSGLPLFLASTQDIFRRAGIRDVSLLEPYKIYEWIF